MDIDSFPKGTKIEPEGVISKGYPKTKTGQSYSKRFKGVVPDITARKTNKGEKWVKKDRKKKKYNSSKIVKIQALQRGNIARKKREKQKKAIKRIELWWLKVHKKILEQETKDSFILKPQVYKKIKNFPVRKMKNVTVYISPNEGYDTNTDQFYNYVWLKTPRCFMGYIFGLEDFYEYEIDNGITLKKYLEDLPSNNELYFGEINEIYNGVKVKNRWKSINNICNNCDLKLKNCPEEEDKVISPKAKKTVQKGGQNIKDYTEMKEFKENIVSLDKIETDRNDFYYMDSKSKKVFNNKMKIVGNIKDNILYLL